MAGRLMRISISVNIGSLIGSFAKEVCMSGKSKAIQPNIVSQIKTPGARGATWGIMLAHAVLPQTAATLPRLLDYLEAKRFKIAQVEDAVCWRFGKHSQQLIR